jgi:hypothetical protein
MKAEKTGIADRACRWCLVNDEGKRQGFFPSKRAAECWARTGKTFKTKPVYAVVKGRKTQKRIR